MEYKLYEKLNKQDVGYMRACYIIDIVVNLSYLFLAVSDNAYMKGQPIGFIAAYALICGILVMLEMALLFYTIQLLPYNILALPVLFAAIIMQSALAAVDIIYSFTYQYFWSEMFLHIVTEITMIVVFVRRYMFLRTAKKMLIDREKEEADGEEK